MCACLTSQRGKIEPAKQIREQGEETGKGLCQSCQPISHLGGGGHRVLMWGSVNLPIILEFLKHVETAIFFLLFVYSATTSVLLSHHLIVFLQRMATVPSQSFKVNFKRDPNNSFGPTILLGIQPTKILTHVHKECAPGTLASSLFLEHNRHTPTLEHSPERALYSKCPQFAQLTLPSFKPVLKCCLIKEASPDHLI